MGIKYSKNIQNQLKNNRLKLGYSHQEAISGVLAVQNPEYKIVDFVGNRFKTQKEMCQFYNIDTKTYVKRKNRNKKLENKEQWTEQELLLGRRMVQDFKGINYRNIEEMCSEYSIPTKEYLARKAKGMSLKERLTVPYEGKSVKDHLGKSHKTVTAMCKAWDIPLDVFKSRQRYKWSLKRSLTEPVSKSGVVDHLGNKFSSVDKMCDHYEINRLAYYQGRKLGISIEDILTKSKKYQPHAEIYDKQKKKTYKNQSEYCRAFGKNLYNIKALMKTKGITIQEAVRL